MVMMIEMVVMMSIHFIYLCNQTHPYIYLSIHPSHQSIHPISSMYPSHIISFYPYHPSHLIYLPFNQSHPSIHIIPSYLSIYPISSSHLIQVLENGFFYGYNPVVVAVIFLQGLGGLIVAVVVKYADNILKGFAASFSIVTSCFLSYLVFDFHPNWMFVMGAVLVNLSMYMYSYCPPVEKEKKRSPEGSLTSSRSIDGLHKSHKTSSSTSLSALESGGVGGGGGIGITQR